MHPKKKAEIQQTMFTYTAKGKKSPYKKVQMKRLYAALDDIFRHERSENLKAIGKRQLIGYWRRTEHETDKTRREKYNILKRFFALYNRAVTVPEPRKLKPQPEEWPLTPSAS